MEFKLVVCSDDCLSRKRACINCGQRSLWGAGSRCERDGHYISYLDTWDEWCCHWRKDKREFINIEACET